MSRKYVFRQHQLARRVQLGDHVHGVGPLPRLRLHDHSPGDFAARVQLKQLNLYYKFPNFFLFVKFFSHLQIAGIE